MTYFHIRMYTIIGAKSFHCPVRDGKEWDQLAMVVRHNCGQRTEDGGQKTESQSRRSRTSFLSSVVFHQSPDLEEVRGFDCNASRVTCTA